MSIKPITKSRTEWDRLRAMSDDEIDYTDIPSTDADFWSGARMVEPSRKVAVTLQLDEKVVAAFQQAGGDYQARINAVLRAYVEKMESGSGQR